MPKVQRLTLFKLDPADLNTAVQAYKKLETDNKKDGSPYILSLSTHILHPDPRSQGFTLLAKSEFASLDDMKYYDDECEAHNELKATVKPLVKGPPATYYFDV